MVAIKSFYVSVVTPIILGVSVTYWLGSESAKKQFGHDFRLNSSNVLSYPSFIAAESFEFSSDGSSAYTGLGNGWIVKIPLNPNHETPPVKEVQTGHPHPRCGDVHLEHICGRPLGLRLRRLPLPPLSDGKPRFRESLLICDTRGLLEYDLGSKKMKILLGSPLLNATESLGLPQEKLYFCNSLALSKDQQVVYFTDSSSRFSRKDYAMVVFSDIHDGRLLKYEFRTKKSSVLLSGLGFPNGLTMSKDHKFLMMAELMKSQVLKVNITDRTPIAKVLVKVPILPDNIQPVNPRFRLSQSLSDSRSPTYTVTSGTQIYGWKGLILKLPFVYITKYLTNGPYYVKLWVSREASCRSASVEFDEEGNIVDVMQGDMRFMSELRYIPPFGGSERALVGSYHESIPLRVLSIAPTFPKAVETSM